MQHRFLSLGALLAGMAVILGAFGAHAMRDSLEPHQREIWHTAVTYQMWHALGLGLISHIKDDSRLLRLSGWLMTFGTVLFCGSLYLLVLSGVRSLGMITPFGGLSLILAWLVLAWYAWRKRHA